MLKICKKFAKINQVLTSCHSLKITERTSHHKNFITKYLNILILKKNSISTITRSPQMERQGTTKVLCSLVCNISCNQWMVTSLHQHFRLQTTNIELRNTLQYFNTKHSSTHSHNPTALSSCYRHFSDFSSI